MRIQKQTMQLPFILGIILGFLCYTPVYATHLMGGELTYICLGNNQYELTLTLYRDCNGIDLGSSQTLYHTDDCGTNSNYSMALVSTQEITPVCPGIVGTACNGGGGVYGIEEFVYQTTVTLDPNCTNVIFSWSLCCRNYAISTLANPGSESMYIKTIIPDITVCNNSPTFLNVPVPFMCVGQPVNYNNGAVDVDGDDLVFSLIDCMDAANNPVVYSAGFNATTALTTTGGIAIDANTGAISFTPSQTEVGVMCVLVEEYRNGIKISEIIRDIQFTVVTCTNDNPTLTGMDSTNVFTTNLKVGNSICFDVFSDDINPGQQVFIQWNEGVPTGTFTIDSSGQFPKGTFCWTPTIDHIGNNVFTVIVSDDNCPLVGMNTYTYNIHVSLDTVRSIVDGDWSDPNTWDCACVPSSLDNIFVRHDVSLGADFTSDNGAFIVVEIGGKLSVLNSYALTIDGDLNNYGTIMGNLIVAGTKTTFMRLGTVEKIEITNPTTLLAAADCSILKALTLSNGTFNCNGYAVVLKSDAQATAMVIDNGGTVTGDLTVQRYLFNTIGHHFICSPLSGATVNELADDFPLDLNTAFPHIYYYDETDSSGHNSAGWLAPTSTGHVMGQAEGYSAYFMAGSGMTLDMTGTLNTGTINIPLTYTPSAYVDTTSCPPEGWNLVGNPYAAPIDFDLLIQSASTDIKKAMYIWDPSTKTYFSYVDGIGSPSTFGSRVPSMQGFWIKTNATTTLTFDNSMRLTNPDDTTNTFFKAAGSPLFRLEMSGQGQRAEIVTRFKPGARVGFDDDMDAFFIPSEYPGFVDFAVATGEGPLSINSMPMLQTSDVTIPLQYKVDHVGTYTIEMTDFSNFGSNDEVILEDVVQGVNHILNNGPYTFTSTVNDNQRRFNVRVVPAVISTIDPLEKEQLNVYKCQDALCLSFPEVNTSSRNLRIYNSLGQLVHHSTLEKGQDTYHVHQLELPSSNVYFIEIPSINFSKAIQW